MIKFSTHWKSSAHAGKQRKYRYNAPLHVKQKLVHAHLSKPLLEKYGLRSAQVKAGDKVKIMRGSFAGREAKVEKVELRLERVYITGIDRVKKDGNRVKIAIHPSNLLIVDLDLGDKKRAAHFTLATKQSKESNESDSKKGKQNNAKVRGSTK